MSPQRPPKLILGKQVETVGVILVHGIGEQRRFEHLESECRKIIDAIILNFGLRRRDVTVSLRRAAGDAFKSNHITWASGPEAPLHAYIDLGNKIIDVGFHEVWWADINESPTLTKQIKFWLWGLSISGIVTNNDAFLPSAQQTRAPNNSGKLTVWHRVRLAYVAMLFGLSTFSVALVNMILKRLDMAPILATRTIVNYLSGVKLFSQTTRAGGSPMDGPDEPPRIAVRRRMIRTMVDVASEDYDRWYILAHSLGSIVAWNALMEVQEVLPNYLSREQWLRISSTELAAKRTFAFNVTAMIPSRPVWLGRTEILDRGALFDRFRGILTYGSPLERFCALWSSTVRINGDEFCFNPGVEWVNVYDPTDPVGTRIINFEPAQKSPLEERTASAKAALKVRNFPCRSSWLLLYSHIRYFRAPQNGSRRPKDAKYWLVNEVANWLVAGGSLVQRLDAAPKDQSTFWMPFNADGRGARVKSRALWRFAEWLLVGSVMTVLALLSIHYLVYPLVVGVVRWIK
jgi:hypothetical protein